MTTEEAALREAVAAAMESCEASSGGAHVRELTFEGHAVRVREVSLGHGVGAKLWKAAVMLSWELVRNPSWCEGRRTLEIGAGVGLCGLLAARLGATRVVLTDFEHPLLDSLCAAVEDNGLGGVAEVAKLDWIREAEEAAAAAEQESGRRASENENDASSASATGRGWGTLGSGETFDFVFGSDLLYERTHAEVLPAVVKRRLAPGGRCRIVGAVRDRALLDALQANVRAVGLEVFEHHLDDNHGDDWYEDGYAALGITHAS